MNTFRKLIIAVTVALSATAFLGQTVFAQQEKGILESCVGDIPKYCSDVTPGNGRIISCIYAHEDKISEECSASMVDIGDALDYMYDTVIVAMVICDEDIKKLCPASEIGGGETLSCLTENSSAVTAECKGSVGELTKALVSE
jgi:hypothetical protein